MCLSVYPCLWYFESRQYDECNCVMMPIIHRGKPDIVEIWRTTWPFFNQTTPRRPYVHVYLFLPVCAVTRSTEAHNYRELYGETFNLLYISDCLSSLVFTVSFSTNLLNTYSSQKAWIILNLNYTPAQAQGHESKTQSSPLWLHSKTPNPSLHERPVKV